VVSPAEYLDEWHNALAEPSGNPGDTLGFETVKLCYKLIEEEAEEACEAICENSDIEHIAKELADLVYVTYGAARAYGIPLDLAVAEVHRSNMTKLTGGPTRRADGKLLKGEHYEGADMKKVIDSVR
jgi:predicted HAD superfamily Cof-like phosphohydrolase